MSSESMRLQFIKPDSGYIGLVPEGALHVACALRLPWRVSLDACALRNALHGEETHLLTGIWTKGNGSLTGRTLIDRDIELRVIAAAGATGESINRCRFEVSVANRSAISRAAPAVVVGFDLPAPPRRIQLGSTDLHVIDALGRLWSLHWPNLSAPARSTGQRTPTHSCVPFARETESISSPPRLGDEHRDCHDRSLHELQPTIQRVQRDLIAITVPLGAVIESGVSAGATGELTMIPAAEQPVHE